MMIYNCRKKYFNNNKYLQVQGKEIWFMSNDIVQKSAAIVDNIIWLL